VTSSFGTNAFYLYLESILTLFLGYLFWIIVSSQVGASNIGESSSAITLATIVSVIATIGMPTAIQRFLGIAKAKEDISSFNAISRFLIVFTIIVLSASSLILIVINHFAVFLGFSDLMFLIIILASISYSLILSLRSIIISSSNTKVLVIAAIFGNVLRFASIALVIHFRLGPEGIAFSYVTFYIALAVLCTYFLRSTFVKTEISTTDQYVFNKGEIIKASISSWIPNVVSILGTQSGLLIVFGLSGSSEAGIYFIAFSIFSAISALPMSVLSMTFPVMSGMVFKREELLWKATKMSLFLTLPIASAITIYPSSILMLFGKEFGPGSYILTILMLSIVMVELNRAVSYLSYSYGRYHQVLIQGLIPSFTRIVAYILLSQAYGGIGTAYAFLMGSVVGLIVAVLIDKKSRYQLPYQSISKVTFLPLAIGMICLFFNVQPVLGIFLIIVISYVLIARMRIITYKDVEESINSVFTNPNTFSKNVLTIARTIFH
jgi:O-antigen/teichoic acid export membrane protein